LAATRAAACRIRFAAVAFARIAIANTGFAAAATIRTTGFASTNTCARTLTCLNGRLGFRGKSNGGEQQTRNTDQSKRFHSNRTPKIDFATLLPRHRQFAERFIILDAAGNSFLQEANTIWMSIKRFAFEY